MARILLVMSTMSRASVVVSSFFSISIILLVSLTFSKFSLRNYLDNLEDDIKKSHGDHDESQDDDIELREGEDETTEEQEDPDVKIEEQEVVGNFVWRNESIKVQDLRGNNLLARLSEGNPSDGRDRIIPPLPVVCNMRLTFIDNFTRNQPISSSSQRKE